ncbi:3994_t:CDS:2 [Diversispora eburnea]|uniref:3994_t:CDS:1 n=1 Tax=Diversispora eburnea TaxID=1213867 RepID=A0A9N9AWY8_9GLOM|nr:3994_t:CDS:2 [Diversispora eburnea]
MISRSVLFVGVNPGPFYESDFTNNEIIINYEDVTLPKKSDIRISYVVSHDTRSSALSTIKQSIFSSQIFIGKCGFDAFEKAYRTLNTEKSKIFGLQPLKIF